MSQLLLSVSKINFENRDFRKNHDFLIISWFWSISYRRLCPGLWTPTASSKCSDILEIPYCSIMEAGNESRCEWFGDV